MRSSILARIPGFRQRIIPEPRVPSRGSQARGTRLTLINKTALPTSPSFQALRNTAFLSFILIPNIVHFSNFIYTATNTMISGCIEHDEHLLELKSLWILKRTYKHLKMNKANDAVVLNLNISRFSSSLRPGK
jgi:hypothetical protein